MPHDNRLTYDRSPEMNIQGDHSKVTEGSSLEHERKALGRGKFLHDNPHLQFPNICLLLKKYKCPDLTTQNHDLSRL